MIENVDGVCMTYTYSKKVIWQVSDEVAHVILNDPPSNQMSKEFFDSLSYVVEKVIAARNIKAIVVYGKGRHFSSGADLGDLLSEVKSETKRDEHGRIIEYSKSIFEHNKAFSFFEQIPIPVIAAIRGVCIGSALSYPHLWQRSTIRFTGSYVQSHARVRWYSAPTSAHWLRKSNAIYIARKKRLSGRSMLGGNS